MPLKWVVVVLALWWLSGCVPIGAPRPSSPYDTPEKKAREKAALEQDLILEGAVVKFIDRGAGVVCWVYVNIDMECLRVGETILNVGGSE